MLALYVLALIFPPAVAQMATDHPTQPANAAAPERLGTVSFIVSCAASVQAPFNRGVALLHDFWYEEAQRQFEEIAKSDPGCAMAHWGMAMSYFHQIWSRPDEIANTHGWAEMQQAQSPAAKTARERAYIAALSDFYRPGQRSFRSAFGPTPMQWESFTASFRMISIRARFMRCRCWRRVRLTTPA